MKKVLFIFIALMVVGAYAADMTTKTSTGNYNDITNTLTFKRLNGYLDAVFIDVASSTTQTITLATTDETILTLTDSVADSYDRIRVPVQNTVGANLSSASNAYERILLCSEVITATIVTSSPTTNDVTIKIKTDDR